jgi:hypothetical protein
MLVRRELDEWLQSSAGQRTDLPPETNLGLGQYLILENKDWNDGLRRLTLSSEGPWREAAERDLAAAISNEPPMWMRCGDGWWNLSDDPQEPVVDVAMGLTDEYRLQLRKRAALWYHKALPHFDRDGDEASHMRSRLRLVDAAD